MLSQYPPLFFRAVDIFADLCDDNHHEGQIKHSLYKKNNWMYNIYDSRMRGESMKDKLLVFIDLIGGILSLGLLLASYFIKNIMWGEIIYEKDTLLYFL